MGGKIGKLKATSWKIWLLYLEGNWQLEGNCLFVRENTEYIVGNLTPFLGNILYTFLALITPLSSLSLSGLGPGSGTSPVHSLVVCRLQKNPMQIFNDQEPFLKFVGNADHTYIL